MARAQLECYVVCAPGLEDVVAGELGDLGIKPGSPGKGGVSFHATNRQLYSANVWLRSASRIVVRVASFRAPSFGALEDGVDEVPWDRWLDDDTAPVFRVSSSGSQLYHTDAVAERLHKRIKAPSDTGPQQLFVVRIVRDRVSISVDTSGTLLHKRGWREQIAKAPLRETLAAAMLRSAGWDGSCGMIDPMCGSGTIVIEAALLASDRPPSLDRSLAFQRWPSFEPGTWASVTGDAKGRGRRPQVVIQGSDRDAGAIAAATANAERAGVADAVTFRTASVSDLTSPAGSPGWVLTNPPYGARLDAGGDLRNLYARLGSVITKNLDGWRCGLLVTDRRLAAHAGLALEPAFKTKNGGLPVTFLTTPKEAKD